MAGVCRYCGRKGAPGNAVDSNGETAMHDGAYKTMPSVVKCLDRHDADIKIWSKPTRNGGHLSGSPRSSRAGVILNLLSKQ